LHVCRSSQLVLVQELLHCARMPPKNGPSIG